MYVEVLYEENRMIDCILRRPCLLFQFIFDLTLKRWLRFYKIGLTPSRHAPVHCQMLVINVFFFVIWLFSLFWRSVIVTVTVNVITFDVVGPSVLTWRCAHTCWKAFWWSLKGYSMVHFLKFHYVSSILLFNYFFLIIDTDNCYAYIVV